MVAKLYVAMYKPVEGNYEHWALYLQNGEEDVVYQVIGEWPHFKYNVKETKPENTLLHRRSIFMCEVNDRDIPELKEHVADYPIDNEVESWNCQDYVVEVLQKLEEECVVDGDDRDYKKAMKELVGKHYGPQ